MSGKNQGNEKSIAKCKRIGLLELQLLQLGIARLHGNWYKNGYCLYCKKVHLPLR
jgi:hypothetical protein